jgi:hypothetical protein
MIYNHKTVQRLSKPIFLFFRFLMISSESSYSWNNVINIRFVLCLAINQSYLTIGFANLRKITVIWDNYWLTKVWIE